MNELFMTTNGTKVYHVFKDDEPLTWWYRLEPSETHDSSTEFDVRTLPGFDRGSYMRRMKAGGLDAVLDHNREVIERWIESAESEPPPTTMKIARVKDQDGVRWHWVIERGEQTKSGYGATEAQAQSRLAFALGTLDINAQ